MKTMMKILVALVGIFVIGGSAMAAEKQKVYKAPEHQTDKMGVKMVRGITNVATGVGEFPRQIIRSRKEDGWLLALPYGLARGLAMTIVRVGYGALETVFFFIPFDGGYESALNPAYVWEEETPATRAIEE